MQDTRDAQLNELTALLDEIGGEQLDGSGFELDEPERIFANPEFEGEE